jgi:hypothetical protein
MDDVRQGGPKTGDQGGPIDTVLTASEAMKQKRRNGETGDGITVKVLGPGIVILV